MNSFFERRYVIAGVFVTLILVLLARLFYIQIIDDRYLLYAQGNVLRRIYVNPARGPIMDRNLKVLVQNEAFYDIMVTPKEVKAFDTVEFCKLLQSPAAVRCKAITVSFSRTKVQRLCLVFVKKQARKEASKERRR